MPDRIALIMLCLIKNADKRVYMGNEKCKNCKKIK